MGRTVVILGASHAGLGVTHKLLRSTALQDVKVVLVSPTTHHYWNLASFRAVIPGAIPDDKIYTPLEQGFRQFPAEKFSLVIGSAKSVDTTAKTVTVQDTEGASQTLSYDALVLATGARAVNESMPWKCWGDYESQLKRLHAVTENVGKAKHIVVAGAGATGIELAGELASAFGGKNATSKKEIILLSSGPEILGGHQLAAVAEKELKSLGVIVRKGATVTDAETTESGQTKVEIQNGEPIMTDLYLPTMGLKPNSEFLDSTLLTEKGHVKVDDHFRVQGVEGVWALGDIVGLPRAAFVHTDNQSPQVARNVEAVLKGQAPSPVKPLPVDPLACSLGPKRGIGRVGFFKIPSFVVTTAKSKTLLVHKGPKSVDGSRW